MGRLFIRLRCLTSYLPSRSGTYQGCYRPGYGRAKVGLGSGQTILNFSPSSSPNFNYIEWARPSPTRPIKISAKPGLPEARLSNMRRIGISI